MPNSKQKMEYTASCWRYSKLVIRTGSKILLAACFFLFKRIVFSLLSKPPKLLPESLGAFIYRVETLILLSFCEYSISEIITKIGYRNTSHFSNTSICVSLFLQVSQESDFLNKARATFLISFIILLSRTLA